MTRYGPAVPAGRPQRWPLAVRLVFFGWLLFPLSLAAAAASMNVTGALTVPPQTTVIALVMAVVVAWTRRGFVPMLVLGLGYGFLHALILDSFGLSHPDSFADFFPALVRTVGLVSVVTGSLIGIRQRRSGGLRAATTRERTAVQLVGVAVVLGAAASFGLTVAGAASFGEAPGAAVVVMRDDLFEGDLEVTAPVTIVVRNEDWYSHTFTLEGSVDRYIGPRASKLVGLPELAPGEYELVCDVTGHDGMRATLLVR